VRERGRQDLERDLALELGIACAIHLAHPAGAERADDLEATESITGVEGHVLSRLLRADARRGLEEEEHEDRERARHPG